MLLLSPYNRYLASLPYPKFHIPRLLVRNLSTETSSPSTFEQNRQRAEDYLRQHAPNHPLEEISSSTLHPSSPHIKPTAKSAAHKRLKKHIPTITGQLPPPHSISTLLTEEHGALDVTVLDVRTKAPFADWLIICSAHTSSHVRAIADGITQDMRQCGLLIAGEVVGVCGRDSDDWMVVDVGPVLVHVMTEDARAHYALERLWTSEVEIDNSEQV